MGVAQCSLALWEKQKQQGYPVSFRAVLIPTNGISMIDPASHVRGGHIVLQGTQSHTTQNNARCNGRAACAPKLQLLFDKSMRLPEEIPVLGSSHFAYFNSYLHNSYEAGIGAGLCECKCGNTRHLRVTAAKPERHVAIYNQMKFNKWIHKKCTILHRKCGCTCIITHKFQGNALFILISILLAC